MAFFAPRIDGLALMYGDTFYYEVSNYRARSPPPTLSNYTAALVLGVATISMPDRQVMTLHF